MHTARDRDRETETERNRERTGCGELQTLVPSLHA